MIAGIAGSIPAEDADVRLLCLSCDVRRADHCQNSPAGCVCVCVIQKPQQLGSVGLNWAVVHTKNTYKYETRICVVGK